MQSVQYNLPGGAQLNIETSDGTVTTVEIALTATAALLKRKVAAVLGTRDQEMMLFYAGSELTDSLTLESYFIADGETLSLEYRSASIREVTLFVALPSRTQITIRVPANSECESVLKAIIAKERLPVGKNGKGNFNLLRESGDTWQPGTKAGDIPSSEVLLVTSMTDGGWTK